MLSYNSAVEKKRVSLLEGSQMPRSHNLCCSWESGVHREPKVCKDIGSQLLTPQAANCGPSASL
jgi:hypothetical protein